jgi:hypothetical protein
MRLYNQTKNELEFSLAGEEYHVKPFGAVNIPDQWIETCRTRRLPLDVSPVPAETKATAIVAEERDAARADEVNKLNEALRIALASEAAAKEECEREKRALDAAAVVNEELRGELTQKAEDILTLEADLEAVRAELGATAQKLELAERDLALARAPKGKDGKPLSPA